MSKFDQLYESVISEKKGFKIWGGIDPEFDGKVYEFDFDGSNKFTVNDTGNPTTTGNSPKKLLMTKLSDYKDVFEGGKIVDGPTINYFGGVRPGDDDYSFLINDKEIKPIKNIPKELLKVI